MKNLPSLRENFRDWLTLPETKVFVDILTTLREDLFKAANQLTYDTFHKKEINEQANLRYSRVDGIDVILTLIDECHSEEPIIKEIDGEKVETYLILDELLTDTYGGKND